MKILLYGENWEGTHVDSIGKVLKDLQVDYKIFDFYKYFLNAAEAKNKFENYFDRIYNRVVYTHIERRINAGLLACVNTYKPSTLIISKGINIYPETIAAISEKSILVINWNPDDYFNQSNSSKHLLASLPLYDIVISSRTKRYEHYRDNGVKRIEFIDWYYIPWLHYKVSKEEEVENKILYAGAYSPKRDWFLSEIATEFPLEVYGAGWAKSKWLRKRQNTKLTRQILGQSSFPVYFRKARVNINILNDLNYDQTNLKLFEITACAGFLLSSYSEEAEKIVNADSDAFYFPIWEAGALNKRIKEIFSMDNRDFETIRNNGHQKIINGKHAINDRVNSLLALCR